ncbi:MAG: B12-binding domain-containing radical SAM protein [Phycisphaerae bacterium]
MTWKRPLLLYPYSPEKKSEHLYGGLAIINPIGLEIVATAIKPMVDDLLLVDMRMEDRPLAEILARFRPDLIAVSLMWGRDDYADALIRSLPADITLQMGGLYATRHPDEVLEAYPNLDILSLGYGDETMQHLLEAGSAEGLAGFWYRDRPTAYAPDVRAPQERDGYGDPPRQVVDTRPDKTGRGTSPSTHGAGKPTEAPLVKNPLYTGRSVQNMHIDRSVRRYEYPWLTLKGDNVITSVGCPMVCAFCKWRENIFGEVQPWIGRTAEDVVDELAETNAPIVHLVDANFAADTDRVRRICDLLIERDIRHLYACEIRVNPLYKSARLVKKMEQAGFFMFMVGLESYQPRLLKAMRKGYTVKMARQAFRHLGQTKILTLGNFLIGNPGETEEEMLGIADYAAELGVDFISPNKIYAYEDSDFERWVLAQPGMKVVGRRGYVVSDSCGVEDLRRIQARIMLRFLAKHPPWIPYRKALAHPMVRKIGRERMRRAMLRSLWNHVADASFRRRAVKRLGKRFRPSSRAAAT